jgi:hypothetical protein
MSTIFTLILFILISAAIVAVVGMAGGRNE